MGLLVDPANESAGKKTEGQYQHYIENGEFAGQVGYCKNIHVQSPRFRMISLIYHEDTKSQSFRSVFIFCVFVPLW
jgi:hypothetical protein